MARTTKQVGDAWGRLAGLAVDACQSHHDAHGEATRHGAHHRREERRGDPNSEVSDVTLTVDQRCPDSWTGKPGQVRVNYDAQVTTLFAPPAMHPLPADAPLSTASHIGVPVPDRVFAGVQDVVVSLTGAAGPSLFVGRLCPANSGTPDVPVLIYIDDVT